MRDDERQIGEQQIGEQQIDEQQIDEQQTYERPTLTPAGSFTNMTGLSGHGPKDTVLKHQLL